MATSRQLALGPMPLQEVAKPVATDGKKVAPLVDLLVRAFARPVPKRGKKAWRSSDVDRWIATRAERALGRL